ncbi:MAG: histidine triad nucleotide-binding protein [Deltaproteobacteria bacterium]
MDCLFCKIVEKKIPSQIVFENEHVAAFRDIRPVAPTHILVIPRVHFASLDEATAAHRDVIGNTLLAAAEIARAEGLAANGYRTVINTGVHAGQTVFHLHVHLLGGRDFVWPPG